MNRSKLTNTLILSLLIPKCKYMSCGILRTLIRLHGYAGFSEPLLDAYALNTNFFFAFPGPCHLQTGDPSSAYKF